MFVRWKKRISEDKNKQWEYEYVDGKLESAHRKSKEEMEYTLSAYLMQSVRVDGKPRQKTIAFIGSLKSRDLEKGKPIFWLWSRIEKIFSDLNLDEETREMVYQALAEKTPRPSAEAIEQDDRRDKALLAAYGLDKPLPPRPPNTPPLLGTTDTTEDIERPLFIKWKREYKGEYHASLAKIVESNGKQKIEIVTKLGSIENFEKTRLTTKGQEVVQSTWKAFWFQIHKSLCKAQVDYHTYHETMRLLGKRIEQPAHEELLQLIQEQQAYEERYIESDIKKTIEQYNRLKKKRDELQDIHSLGKQYLGKNVEAQIGATAER